MLASSYCDVTWSVACRTWCHAPRFICPATMEDQPASAVAGAGARLMLCASASCVIGSLVTSSSGAMVSSCFELVSMCGHAEYRRCPCADTVRERTQHDGHGGKHTHTHTHARARALHSRRCCAHVTRKRPGAPPPARRGATHGNTARTFQRHVMLTRQERRTGGRLGQCQCQGQCWCCTPVTTTPPGCVQRHTRCGHRQAHARPHLFFVFNPRKGHGIHLHE